MGTKLVGDHLSRGTKFDGDRLSMGTKLVGDHFSMGTKFMGTIFLGTNFLWDKKVRGLNENIEYIVDLRTLYRPVVWMKEY